MKTQYAQMEVLLITGTTFLSRDLWEKDESRQNSLSSENEQLEEACWNGLLQTLLPEIFAEPIGNSRLYLWEVKTAASFLQLDMGEAPTAARSPFSIVPNSFLSTQSYN
ncbi:MAG TPA: hypothetical protein VKQ52_18680 [Puia sp.]|nr:hypothetical protein [Puia sp.]